MPPPRSVSCEVCGQQFFKHSYPLHLKRCKEKHSKAMTNCPKCQVPVYNDEYSSHTSNCKAKVFGENSGGKKQTSKRDEAGLDEYDILLQKPPVVVETEDGFKRIECRCCSRKFSVERIAKHEVICVRNSRGQRRKKFPSSSEMRLRNTEFKKYVGSAKIDVKISHKRNWRQEHLMLKGVVQQGLIVKEFQKANIPLTELPPLNKDLESFLGELEQWKKGKKAISGEENRSEVSNSGLAQCPHCSRTFNPKIAQRHIESCKNIRNRPTKLIRKSFDARVKPSSLKRPSKLVLTAIKNVVSAIANGATKSSFYDTKKAMMFNPGDLVMLKGKREGVVRYVGRVAGLHNGYWLGVEATSECSGQNNGSFEGKQYFSCKPGCGVFVRPGKARKLQISSINEPSEEGDNDSIPNILNGRFKCESEFDLNLFNSLNSVQKLNRAEKLRQEVRVESPRNMIGITNPVLVR